MENIFFNNTFSNKEILEQANYILKNKSTIRATALYFRIPKSTLHHNLKHKLKHINLKVFFEVQELMKNNFKIKHIHGGESTKRKYQQLKEIININDKIEAINF